MKITALTYNISWAVQKNILAGSEKNFVQMCQNKDIKCFDNTIKIIQSIQNLHLIGLQEVNTTNLEKKLIKSLEYCDSFERGKVGLSSVSLIWNSNIFGKKKVVKTINLSTKDDRPCLYILTTKGYLLISAHFPYFKRRNQLDSIYNLIKTNAPTSICIPIILADTNDAKTLINKNKPFQFGKNKLSQGLTKAKLRKELITCCWHEEGHKYSPYDATGDYILAPSKIMTKNYIPILYKDIYGSDHRPVLADLQITK
jgi:hypothetical protein